MRQLSLGFAGLALITALAGCAPDAANIDPALTKVVPCTGLGEVRFTEADRDGLRLISRPPLARIEANNRIIRGRCR